MSEITLLESFDHGAAGWLNYDTYDPTLRPIIHDQRHVDLFNFATVGASSDTWSAGTIAPRADRNNLPSLRVSVASGTTAFNGYRTNANGGYRPTDILTGFDDTDHFVLSLPTFPLAAINLASSWFELTSLTGGTFTPGDHNAHVTLNSSVIPLVAGDSEFRIPVSSLKQNNIDLTAVTAIRFSIVATATAIFEVNGIRVMDANWQAGTIGQDTQAGVLKRIPNRTGGLTAGFDQPILWRSAEPAGSNDPRPIDANLVVPFRTGSSVSGSNRISLYFRELTEDFLTQLDLDGMTQAELDGHPQPDIGLAKYNPRTIGELSKYRLSELSDETVFSLERTPDFLSASWIEFTLQWGTTNQITIQDTEGNGYNFSVASLTANSNYVFATFLEENQARAILYAVDATGVYQSTIFDTTAINDDTAFQRRKGRFGWYANFNDGDTRVFEIAPNGVTFAEYRSYPFVSQTPVIGAELFATNSPSNELFTGLSPYIYQSTTVYPVVTRDTAKSLSGESWRIDLPTSGVAGDNTIIGTTVWTNDLLITDYENSVIEFDVFMPASAVASGKTLLTYVQGFNFDESYQLVTPIIVGDQWQHIKIDFTFATKAILPGKVKLKIKLNVATDTPITYWIDNLSIRERTVIWDGRAVVDDPWASNNAKWQPYRDNFSRENGGIVFDRRGDSLQIRGRARKPNSTIDRVQYKPRYSELGRILAPPPTPQSYEYVNVIANPNGDTTAGWQVIDVDNVISAVTDGGLPALQDVGATLSTLFVQTQATSITYTPNTKYFISVQARKTTAHSAIAIAIGLVIWDSANPTFKTFADNVGITNINSEQIASGDVAWHDLTGVLEIPQSIITATGYTNARIGLTVQWASFSASSNTTLARRMTLVPIPKSKTITLSQGFDGNSPNAQWQGPAPTTSKYTYNPFQAPINPTWSASNVGLVVTLTAASSIPASNYEWNFGDGVRGAGSRVVHTYAVSGTYPVSLVVTDFYGNQATYVNTVAV